VAQKKPFFRRRVMVGHLPDVIRHKWGDSTLQEGVTSMPKQLVRTLSSLFGSDGGIEQLQVALTLVDYRRPGSDRYPTIEFLAYLAGLPEARFRRRLDELVGLGYVSYRKVRNVIEFDVAGLLSAIARASSGEPPVEPSASGGVSMGDVPF
jgi:hypothetical protein